MGCLKNCCAAVKACIEIMGKAKAAMKLHRPVSGKAISAVCRCLGHAHGDLAQPLQYARPKDNGGRLCWLRQAWGEERLRYGLLRPDRPRHGAA